MSETERDFRSQQHEFTDEQNRTISDLAASMSVVATLLQLLGLVFGLFAGLQAAAVQQLGYGIGPPIGLGVAALLFLALGFWTGSAARSFRRIVESRNEDLWHLMNALGKLHNMYSLLRTLILGSIVLVVVAAVIVAVNLIQGR
jgi:hypothetical protein